MEKIFSNVRFKYYLVFIVFIISVLVWIKSLDMVGKNFSGFILEGTLTLDPSTYSNKDWETYNLKIPEYSRLISINGIKIKNIEYFNNFIESKKVGESLNYIFEFEGKIYKKSVKISTFYFKDFIFSLFFVFPTYTFLFLSFICISRNKTNKDIHKLFYLNLSFAIRFSIFILVLTQPELQHLVYIFMAPNILSHFIYFLSFLSKSKRILYLSKLNISFAFIFSLTITSLYLYIYDDIQTNIILFNIYFKLYMFFVFYLANSFIMFPIIMIYSYFKTRDKLTENNKFKMILLGSIVSFTPVFLGWFIPWFLNIKTIVNVYVTMYFVGLFPVFLTYSILKYKSFNIQIRIRRNIVYLSLTFLALLFFLSTSWLISFVFNISIENISAFNLKVITLLSLYFTYRLKNITQIWIDNLFYSKKYTYIELSYDYYNLTFNISSIDTLLSITEKFISKAIDIYDISFFNYDNDLKSAKNLKKNNDTFYADIDDIKTFDKNYDTQNDIVLKVHNNHLIIGLILIKYDLDSDYSVEESNYLNIISKYYSQAFIKITFENKYLQEKLDYSSVNAKLSFIQDISSTLSHDLKSPVVSLQNNINKVNYMLLNNLEVSKEHMLIFANNARKYLSKINNYIQTSIDSELYEIDKLNLLKDYFNLIDVIEDCIFFNEDYAKRKNIYIDKNYSDTNLIVLGDKVRLERTFLNIINNGLKYANKILKINVIDLSETVLIEIIDDGNGIKGDLINNIFEKYASSEGTGLGLYISKKYINSMNGEISFETSTNGTIFKINLPKEKKQ